MKICQIARLMKGAATVFFVAITMEACAIDFPLNGSTITDGSTAFNVTRSGVTFSGRNPLNDDPDEFNRFTLRPFNGNGLLIGDDTGNGDLRRFDFFFNQHVELQSIGIGNNNAETPQDDFTAVFENVTTGQSTTAFIRGQFTGSINLFPRITFSPTDMGRFSTIGTLSSDAVSLNRLSANLAEPPEPPRPLLVGTTIGLDFGGSSPTNTPGNNFVETNGLTAIPAGRVHDLNGSTIEGISVSFVTAGRQFSNDNGSNADYSSLLPGTAVDPFFEESVVTDLAVISGSVYSVVFSGLDPNLTYDVTAVSASDSSEATDVLTVGLQSSTVQRGTSSTPTFHNLTGLTAPGGVLSLDFSQLGGSTRLSTASY